MMETGTIIVIIIAITVFFVGLLWVVYKIGKKLGAPEAGKEILELRNQILQMKERHEKQIKEARKDASSKTRAIVGGQFSEQLAPFLPDFNHLPTECKFIGKPIDLIVFKGMDKKDINEIVFVEIKSGKSTLSSTQRKLRETIINKSVSWEEYRIPNKLTKNYEKNSVLPEVAEEEKAESEELEINDKLSYDFEHGWVKDEEIG